MRWRLSLIGLALLSLFALLHQLAPHAYLFFTRIPDGAAKPHPFADLRAILQGGVCWRQGVNVYAPSACLQGGTFNYAPMLLRLALLPIGPQNSLAGGLLFCTAFFAALALLPPPASQSELLLRCAAVFSPAIYYALEQGNLDVAIFAATLLAIRLDRRIAYAIFTLAAAAKFYPVAFLALALREKRRVLLPLAASGLGVCVLALALYGHDIATALATIPSGTPFRASFGRIDLFRGLALLHLLPRGVAGLLSWVLAALALCRGWARRKGWRIALASLDEPSASFLIASALVTCFCFLAAQNIEYRAIFLLPALPALARLAPTGLSFRLLPWVILLLLWEAVPRALLSGLTQPYLPNPLAVCLWLLRQTLWWGLFAELSAIILAYVITETARLGLVKIDAGAQKT